MNERSIHLTEIDPKEFFGTQNSTLKFLKSHFPKLKIVARGAEIKAFGEPLILDEFEKRLQMLVKYFDKYNHLDENAIEQLLTSNGSAKNNSKKADGVLVHGVGGNQIKAQTENQRRMVAMMETNDMLFAIGPDRKSVV